jgi:hypothetical protein
MFASPASGKPTTTFTVRFRAPRATGRFGRIHRHTRLNTNLIFLRTLSITPR